MSLNLQPFASAVYTKKPVPGYKQRVFHGGEAILYTPEDPSKKHVLSFRGTQSLYDAVTDVGIVTGRRRMARLATPYGRRMRRMERVTESVLKEVGKDDLLLTGHSLGGHIAEVMACRYKVRAKVYNKGAFFTKTCPQVTSVRTRGDLVSMFGRNQQTQGSRDWNPLHAHGIDRFEGGAWKGFSWIGRQLKTGSKVVSKVAKPIASKVLGPQWKLVKMVGDATGLDPFDYVGNAEKIYKGLKNPRGTLKGLPAHAKKAAIQRIVDKVPANRGTKAALKNMLESQ